MGNLFFSAKGHLDTYNIIHRSYKITNLKTSLLYLVKHLINSPLMPWQGQTQSFCGPYIACRQYVHHPCSRISVRTILKLEPSRGHAFRKTPHFRMFYLHEYHWILVVISQERPSPVSGKGRKE
uniref:Uncharacterized protein n=1 Tax=Myotis myotis TaxID=51298 RepID=A0A7J7WVT7_MYOMY|nr:hypothetical protein mMyoMyo1_011923 [Myotis myotis]